MKTIKTISRIILFSFVLTTCIPVLSIKKEKQTRFQRYKKTTVKFLKKYGWTIPLVFLGIFLRDDIGNWLKQERERPQVNPRPRPRRPRPYQNAHDQMNERNEDMRRRWQEQQDNEPHIDREGGNLVAQSLQALRLQNRRINILGFGLRNFFHLETNSPISTNNRWSCGMHTLENMKNIDSIVFGRHIENQRFINECNAQFECPMNVNIYALDGSVTRLNQGDLFQIIPDAAGVGTTQFERAHIANQLNLSPHTEVTLVNGRVQQEATFPSIAELRNELNRHGPRVVHILCGIPGHVFLMTAIKIQDETSLYLFDNLNNQAVNYEQPFEEMQVMVQQIHNQIIQ